MSKQQWSIPDLIDLEYFLDQDDGQDLDNLAVRDRKIYAQSNTQSSQTTSPSFEMYKWLVSRRELFVEEGPDVAPPGRVWRELMLLLCWATFFSGLVSGGALAFSFLSYSGTRPANVSAYFGIFVLLQIVLFVVLIAFSLYRRMLGKGLEGSVFYRTLRNVFLKILDRIGQKTIAGTSADTQSNWSAFAGNIHQLQRQYGALAMRPFFLVAQIFGVSFNAGVLAATLLKVIGSDIAFGWQTTLQIKGEVVHSLVRLISLPWSWAVPQGVPSLNQIEGSQLILKDGIYHMATQDLVSWWPFLCLAVLFYGLLPRLALLLIGLFQQRRDLNQLSFDRGRCRQVLHRMKTPVVSTLAHEEAPRTTRRESIVQKTSKKISRQAAPGMLDVEPVKNSSQEVSSEVIAALIPDELFDEFPYKELKAQVAARLGYEIIVKQPFWTLDQTEEQEVATLKEKMQEKNCLDVFLLQEAWQPPIQEFFSFLKKLRTTLGEQSTIIILLVGKPATDTVLTPVETINLQVWQQKISALADPGLQLVELVK